MILLIVLLVITLAPCAAPAQETNFRFAGEPWTTVEITDRDGNGVEDYFNPGNLPLSADSVDIAIHFGRRYDPVADSARIEGLLGEQETGGHVTLVHREVPVIWAQGVRVMGAVVDTITGEVLNPSFRTVLDSTEATAVGAQRLYAPALQTSVRSIRARSDPLVGIEGVWRWNGSAFVAESTLATGRGVTMAILDSGVDNSFFNLQEGEVGFVDIPGNETGGSDPNDHNPAYHGTRLAAISTAMLPQFGILGVAPEARIVDVNVAVDSTGYTSMKLLMKALEWCIRNRNQTWPGGDSSYTGIDLAMTGYVDVGYTPYGHIFQSGGDFGRTCDSSYDPPDNAAINLLVNKLVQSGVAFVAAAGNCGCDTLYRGGLGLIANAGAAIAVSAVTDWNTVPVDDDSLAPYSSYGDSLAGDQKPEISAPGTDIFSNTWTGCGGTNDFASGTSFAAPHVAGAVALMIERAPGVRPDSLRSILMNSASDRGATGWDAGFGAGIVDCRAAIDLLP